MPNPEIVRYAVTVKCPACGSLVVMTAASQPCDVCARPQFGKTRTMLEIEPPKAKGAKAAR